MPELQLTAGTIDYIDTGGDGPVLLFLHGLLMDNSQWRHLVPELQSDHRCIAPTLPIGAHRAAMKQDADLSLRAQVKLVAELIDCLDLDEFTIIGIDTGGGLAQLLVEERPEGVARLVLISAEAFENYPPGVPGHAIWFAAQLPGGVNAALQPLRLRALRRLPITFGWMAKRPVPDDVMDAWLEPAHTSAAIRRDIRKYVRGARRDRRHVLAASEAMSRFDRPVLVVYSDEDRVFPGRYSRRLAETAPQARIVEIPDAYTLITEDQPEVLLEQVRAFLASTALSLHGQA